MLSLFQPSHVCLHLSHFTLGPSSKTCQGSDNNANNNFWYDLICFSHFSVLLICYFSKKSSILWQFVGLFLTRKEAKFWQKNILIRIYLKFFTVNYYILDFFSSCLLPLENSFKSILPGSNSPKPKMKIKDSVTHLNISIIKTFSKKVERFSIEKEIFWKICQKNTLGYKV